MGEVPKPGNHPEGIFGVLYEVLAEA